MALRLWVGDMLTHVLIRRMLVAGIYKGYEKSTDYMLWNEGRDQGMKNSETRSVLKPEGANDF